jgi:KEOPS complex subunit Pcc1
VTAGPMGRPHRTVLTFAYDDPEHARRVERSIRPEVGDIDGDRSAATVDRDGATLTVTVAGDDLTALRAGLTTWTGLVAVAERTGGAVDL